MYLMYRVSEKRDSVKQSFGKKTCSETGGAVGWRGDTTKRSKHCGILPLCEPFELNSVLYPQNTASQPQSGRRFESRGCTACFLRVSRVFEIAILMVATQTAASTGRKRSRAFSVFRPILTSIIFDRWRMNLLTG